MLRRFGLTLLLLLPVGLARAQEAPEALLPAGAQLYVRWDGIEAHRAAYEKTALGKTMQGDLGTFVTGLFKQTQESLGAAIAAQQLLSGTPPEKLQKMQADAAEAPRLLEMLGKQGFVLALEVRSLEPPQGQLTLVLPDAGEKPGPLFGALRLAAAIGEVDIKTVKIEGRSVSTLALDPVHHSWWVEGKHAVVTIGTDPPDAVVKRIADAKGAKLTENPLFKKVSGFKEFETGSRGFIDVAGLAKLAQSRGKEVTGLLDDLGISGITSLTFYSGFDGPAERSLAEVHMPGPRKGVLKLAGGKPFTLADVPPIPDDATSWSMTNFDLGTFHDVALAAVEQVTKIVAPDEVPQLKEAIKQVDLVLGIDLRKDLLASLDGQFAQYNSPSEGPLSLGQTFLFKVKDEKKLLESLEQALKGIAKTVPVEIDVKKRKYRGVEMREIYFKQEGVFFVPSYAVVKGWLVVGYFPQAVQGFILRSQGEVPLWKPTGEAARALESLPKEFTAISVSDPRPGVRQLLSLAPLLGGLVRSLAKDQFPLDVGSIPNAHAVTKHLFPNVSVTTDDGKVLRLETRASLALPVEMGGLDTYTLFLLASFGFSAF